MKYLKQNRNQSRRSPLCIVHYALCISATLLLLSSCGLYNKYHRPDEINTQGLIRDVVNDGDTLKVNSDENFGNLPGARSLPIRSCSSSSTRHSRTTPTCAMPPSTSR